MKKILMIGPSLIALLVFGCGSSDTTQEHNSGTQAAAQSTTTQSKVPASTGTTVSFAAYDVDGFLHQSDEWIGKQPVVINFWGTWCPPCRAEIPDLVRIYNDYRDKGIELVGIAVRDQPNNVKQFAGKNGMDWPMLMVDENVIAGFPDIRNVPTTIFFDRNGNEVQRFVGGRDYETFKQAFEQIL
ncbi:MAG TPA: TlpA disulfide reductase family protein [candidate division Zixibacteria bacterium]|nr:TlpA disulfide reductase family protein [candidate division Zixibacteria bacterium]